MSDVPYVIDIRDDVERARETTTEDVGDGVNAVLERLEGYSERTGEDREGILDVLENELLRLEERTEGDAAEYFRSARNRIHVYRDARAASVDEVFVLESKARPVDGDADAEPESIRGERAEFRLTLVNEGDEPRGVVTELTFYGRDGQGLASHVSEAETVDGNEQETVTMRADVAEGTEYYAARVAATDEEEATARGV